MNAMLRNKRILVVDDEEIIRDVLAELLSSESYTVETAENGSKALEMVRNRDYGCILLDLMLPDLDGLQVLEELNTVEDRPEVIILTAYASIEKAIQANKGRQRLPSKNISSPL